MARLNEDKTKTIYDSYDDYLTEQRKKFHQYDCPNCFQYNTENIELVKSLGLNYDKILDCGARDFSWSDPITLEGKDCTGIDISPESVEWARSKGRKMILGDVCSMSTIFSCNTFDLLVSNHNIEHILKVEQFLTEAYFVLKIGGHILIRCPHQTILDNDEGEGTLHCRTYNEEELKSLFSNGFNIVFYKYLKETHEHIIIGKKVI